MADIFSFDEEHLSAIAARRLLLNSAQNLNYRIIEENAPKEDNNDDTLGDLRPTRPMKINRRSSLSKYSSSYEIDINEAFVSSLNKNSPYTLASNANRSGFYKPQLADFEPIKVLGKGSYGKVLLVREVATGRLFAQKQLKKASLIINETNEVHLTNYQRTLNEKTILEKVHHSNIVKLFYAFQDHNKVYLILEYLDGGELFHHLAQEKFMSETNAAYYVAQMVLAIRYLHVHLKVIYRDLKPENCMLNLGGNLVLTDFGLSKESSSDAKNHSMTGTAQYMAPEILKGEPYDYAVDWWSLGCVVFDLLTGSPPFTGNNNKKIMEKILAAKKLLKFPFYLSLDAKDLLRKLLQQNPEKRFNIDDDFDKLKKHRFFRNVDWDHLENLDISEKDILPPILPVITDPILAENFDAEFTEMAFTPPLASNGFSANLPPENGSDKNSNEILHVNGFSFTNESYLNSRFG